MKRIIALVLSLLISLSIYIPVSAANDSLTIKFKIESSRMTVNTKVKTVEKPFLQKKTVFVPMEAVLESYGAEINYLDKGKINLVYRDITVNFTVNSKTYIMNEITKPFTSNPKYINKIVMVPVDFIISNFGGLLKFDKNTGMYAITLEDDGAVTDFSKLIGSIGKPKIGNSYFGWSIGIPKGSQLINSSFNSKDITIENEQRGINIDVSVDVNEGKKIEDYINEMKDGSDDSSYTDSGSNKILDSSIISNTVLPYGEILTSDYGKGGIILRIYISGGYVFKVSCSSTDQANPKKLKQDAYFMSLVNSFKLGYKGGLQDTKDMSKVKDGMAKYIDPLYGFSLNVPPEWNKMLSNEISDIRSLKIGLNENEYINITPELVEGLKDIEIYGDTVKNFYDENFNKKYYSFIEKKSLQISGLKASKLVYRIDYNGQKSVYDENLISSGELVNRIKLKAPESEYIKSKEIFNKILDSINYAPKDLDLIKKSIESIKTDTAMSKVGKDDAITEYIEKNYNWKINLPGYWGTVSYLNDNLKMFSNEKSQSFVGVESIENSPDTATKDDKLLFDTLKSLKDGKDEIKFISNESINKKGITVQVYTYRLEDYTVDMHGSIVNYVIRGDKYSYCFFYFLQDIYASDKNVKEISDIWDSFTVV